MDKLIKGDFVKVGEDIGVVVHLENEGCTPIDHLGIWYGEKNEQGNPLYRTVPEAYCIKLDNTVRYH